MRPRIITWREALDRSALGAVQPLVGNGEECRTDFNEGVHPALNYGLAWSAETNVLNHDLSKNSGLVHDALDHICDVGPA